MAEPFPRAHFILALATGLLSFFVVVPVVALSVFGDRVHAYSGAQQVGFVFACTMAVVFLVYLACERAWRGAPTGARWRKAAMGLLIVLITPVVTTAFLVGLVFLGLRVAGLA